MYCRNCGKEIEGDAFCKYCGTPAQGERVKKVSFSFSEAFLKIRKYIKEYGHHKLVNIVSWLGATASIINRITHSEIETEYSILSQDDYFVLAEESHGTAAAFIWLTVILCGLLTADAHMQKIPLSKRVYISFTFAMLVQIAAMFLRMPAPY